MSSPDTQRHGSPSRIRIYDLSRELNRDNKDILEACDALGITYKSHSSTIAIAEANQVRQRLGAPLPSDSASENGNKPQIVGVIADVPAATSTEKKVAETPPKLVRPVEAAAPKRVMPKPARPAAASPTAAKPSPATPVEAAKPARPAKPPKAAEPKVPELVKPPELVRLAEPAKPTAPAAEAAPAEPKLDNPKAEPPKIVRPVAAKPVAPRPVAPKPAAVKAKPPEIVRPVEAPRPRPEATTEAPKNSVRPARKKDVPVRMDKPNRPVTEKPKPAIQLVGRPTLPGEKATIEQPKSERPEPPRRSEGMSPPVRKELVSPPSRPARPVRPNMPDLDIEQPRVTTLDEKPSRPASPSKTTKKPSRNTDDDGRGGRGGPGKSSGRKGRNRKGPEEEEGFDSEVITGSVELVDNLTPLPRPPRPTNGAPAATPQRPPASRKRSKPSRRTANPDRQTAASAVVEDTKPTSITLDGELTVQELAAKMEISETEIIKVLFMQGVMVSITQTLDVPTAELVAKKLEFEVVHQAQEAAAKKTEMLDISDIDSLVLRPPVVTIMGHVDHGKTTLLDSIRSARVAQGEAGGITQHIGAYHVDLPHNGEDKRIVFLDTPGHEAFTAMRARGAKVTDIAILVVAADDGVRPQTLEAISHAQAANVPIVVAINKVDKESANPERVKQELAERGLVPEEWGGDVPMVGVSALARQNLDELLEMILLVAEVGELQANPDRTAKGTIIEANLDKARGPVATLLVQNGTLRVGDTFVAGSILGRVKAMVDDRGNRVKVAGPSSAVEVLGLNEVPIPGDEFEVFTDEKQARALADERAQAQRQSRLQQTMASRRVTLGSVSAQVQEGELKELPLLLKADVQGSVEAILGSLQQLPNTEVQVRVLLATAGEITETDIDLAAASGAVIVGFNTSLAPGARQSADANGVDIREYDIIYNLLEEITAAMEGLLEPEEVEEPLGQVEVRQVITIGKGTIAGAYVQSGKIARNAFIRVKRRNEVVFTGRLDSLKRFKDDAKEVASGFECGIGVEKFNSWELGDILEVYQLVTKRRSLSRA